MFYVILDDIDTVRDDLGHITPGDVLNQEQFEWLMSSMDYEPVKCIVFNNEADAMEIGGGY